MSERKLPERHPSTAIPTETVEEIAYRVFLQRLEPPMTPQQSRLTTRERDGKVVASDDTRRAAAKGYESMTRTYLRVLVDMGMVKP